MVDGGDDRHWATYKQQQKGDADLAGTPLVRLSEQIQESLSTPPTRVLQVAVRAAHLLLKWLSSWYPRGRWHSATCLEKLKYSGNTVVIQIKRGYIWKTKKGT